MFNIVIITTFIVTPFIFIFGGGGLMLTLTFMLIGLLDYIGSYIIIMGFVGTAFLVYIIINIIIYITDLFIRDVQIYNMDVYKKRSFWYMCIIIIISCFYYSIYEKLKDDYIYY